MQIVAIGGQSDGKSSLLEAFLGFRFNIREVEMGTRRPLICQMVHDKTGEQPCPCLQAAYSHACCQGDRTLMSAALSPHILSGTAGAHPQPSLANRPGNQQVSFLVHCSPGAQVSDSGGRLRGVWPSHHA